MTFTKLFSSITESTVWCEDSDTRVVWITMLAMANKNGFVFGSEPGLASRAKVSLDATVKALKKFQEPDPWSRSKEFEGRRIETVDGGWRLLNYHKHRSIRDEEDRQEYMRRYMREYRVNKSVNNVSNVNSSKPPLAEAEAEADSRSNKVKVSLRKREQASRIPDDFIPKTEHYEIAKGLGINCEMEFQKFRDYFLGLSGPKAVKRDWNATLRNWLRNSLNYRNGGINDNYKTTTQLRNERSAIALQRAFAEVEAASDKPSDVLKGTKRG